MILLTGGTGYAGSHLLAYLRHRGEPVRVLVRDPQKHQSLVTGNVGVFKGDVTDPASLREAMQGVDTVINLVAIIRQRPGGVTFERLNYGGTVNVVDVAKEVGVKRIIQQSALGARSDPKLPYFDTKYRAEQYVQRSGLAYAILRPSVIFGKGDEFVNKLADLVRKPLFVLPAPIVPVVGDGSTLFSPVWVGDWATALIAILDNPALDGKIYEIGGPRKIRYDQMMNEIMEVTGIHRTKLNVPIPLMRLPVLIMDKILPNPPVAIEQLKMLRLDNSTNDNATARLTGQPLRDFREGIDFINTPLREQKEHVQALAAGSSK